MLNEVVQETAEKPAVAVKPEEAVTAMAATAVVTAGINVAAKEEPVSVVTEKPEYSVDSSAGELVGQEAKESVIPEIKSATDKAAAEETAVTQATEKKPAADDIADQTVIAAKRVREIFSPDAAPYLDTQHLSQTLGEVHSMPLSEEIRREQDALIELIRENQRQVAELHRLMEQRIELEKMRISAYESTLAAERKNRNAAEQRNALQNSSQNIAPGQEVDEP